ncbi:MAG TPA: glycosyltransferase [Thermoanaerobaculia bacterium]
MTLVSIIMPVYNRERMVREAIESALAATIPVELIVVDDASTDGTWDVVRSYPGIRAIRLAENGGQLRARNRGLDEARGKYVKYLDSDDLLLPEHLALEVAEAERVGAEVVASGWVEAYDDGRRVEFAAPRFASSVDDLLAGRAVPTSAALYRRDAAPRWEPEVQKLDDWDYFCRAVLKAERVATVDGPAYVWRHHGGPRITDASMVVHARVHHQVLHRIEAELERRGELTPARRLRLAQYFYKELRVLSLHDRAAFEAGVAHIRTLDPHFHPVDEERQRWMRVAARVLGFRRAILLHSGVKRLLRG